MANTSGTSNAESREAEVEEARAQLASTIDKLTSPETHEAVRAEVLGIVEGYKDELLKRADSYKDELLQKADEYKSEIMERAERYKGEFISRADQYKGEALERAQTFKDEVVQRARDAGRQTVQNVADDLKTRAMNSPLAVALIAGGLGYRLYKHPPITTILVGAGAVMLMRARGRSNRQDRSAHLAPYDAEQPRGYVPGGVAGYGFPAEEDAPESTTVERIASSARETATRVREATQVMGSAVAEAAGSAKVTAAAAAGDAYQTAGGMVRTVRQNPLLLALAGLGAGVAVAGAVRSSERGDRAAQRIRRGARQMTDQLGRSAKEIVENVSGLASAAAANISDVADTAPADVMRRTRGNGRGAGSIGAVQRTSQEIQQMAERYPLLLGSLGLAAGAAAGAMLRSTAVEDRSFGQASDTLKRRIVNTAAEQFNEVATAADKVISSQEARIRASSKQANPAEPAAQKWQVSSSGGKNAGDLEKNAVQLERASEGKRL